MNGMPELLNKVKMRKKNRKQTNKQTFNVFYDELFHFRDCKIQLSKIISKLILLSGIS